MRAADAHELRRDTVLVIDDTPETLSLLTDTLDQAGFTVLIATDGAAALELMGLVTPDLVLMDAVMPGLSGFETCRRLKRDRLLSHLPVIFMTGLTETEHVIEGLACGGVDYVTKPIVLEELLARIRVHLGNARVAHETHAVLDASGRFLFAASRAGRILWCTPKARQLLHGGSGGGGADPAGGGSEAGGGGGVSGAGGGTGGSKGRAAGERDDDDGPRGSRDAQDCLPPQVIEQILRLRRADTRSPTQCRIDLGGRQLDCSFVSSLGSDELLFRLSETGSGCPQTDQRTLVQAYSLTSREAEVLLWISRGKANRDIGEILQISPRTVNKHLEQVFVKMGVENRAAAAAAAVRTLTR